MLQEARSQELRLAMPSAVCSTTMLRKREATIATTSALQNVMALLQLSLAFDAPEWFEVIAAGDIVPAKKPAPDIYQYVLEKMSLSAQDCIAIEDSLHGLQAATSVGIKYELFKFRIAASVTR